MGINCKANSTNNRVNRGATTTIPVQVIRQQTVTTTMRTTTTATILLGPYSNIISDYMFYGTYTVKY